MKLTVGVAYGVDDQLIFAQQLGADGVFAEAADWDGDSLACLANRVRSAGLTLDGCEWPRRASRWTGGDPADPEEAVAEGSRVIANAAEVGVPLVSCRWSPIGMAADDAWDVVTHVAPRLGTAAETAGVRLAWEWGDLPGSGGGGITAAPENLMRPVELSSSRNCGLDLAVGAMATTDQCLSMIRQVSDRIFSVLLSNHSGGPEHRHEAVLDQGDLDVVAILAALKGIGFSGPLRAAPGPRMVGDTEWGHKARAFDLGYVRAVLQSLEWTPGT